MKAVISTLPILKFHSCRSLCIGKQHPICILASRKNINTESKHKIYQLVVEAGTHPAETQPQLLRPASTSYAWTSSRLNMPTKYKRSWVLSEQELFQVNLYPEVWKPTNYSSSRWVPDLTPNVGFMTVGTPSSPFETLAGGAGTHTDSKQMG
jgi:hypothetical protein